MAESEAPAQICRTESGMEVARRAVEIRSMRLEDVAGS